VALANALLRALAPAVSLHIEADEGHSSTFEPMNVSRSVEQPGKYDADRTRTLSTMRDPDTIDSKCGYWPPCAVRSATTVASRRVVRSTNSSMSAQS
jgi:hypothetical protein